MTTAPFRRQDTRTAFAFLPGQLLLLNQDLQYLPYLL